ncbi:MAG: DNA gyrase subunit A [Parcubacteria group bacterium]|nr:DNA gyrase subunit A [Parcubacteria group bacterium]
MSDQQPKLLEDFVGKITEVDLSKEMSSSYLDYAMSVIVLRALPDVRDGLKPVHRRILVTLKDLHLYPQGRYRKSAKICGDVSGNYHPHGEAIVYPSMVRLAQEFSYRYPLVKGQGNFGSLDGDPPAAMRYTEAKMTAAAAEILEDLDKETVDWRDNYDGTRKEPAVLPSKLPNLLINGSLGIAVGMATNIPPHNLTEVCDGLIYLIDHPDAAVDDLTQFIKGPDFPTGGVIYNESDIANGFATGKGSIVVRGRAEIVEGKGGMNIIISEIPYQVSKAALIEKIADLVKDKKVEGIKDLRDESDKDVSVRVVIELKKGTQPQKILNQLYQLTPLQEKFHVNMLALVDGIQPRILNLKMILEEHVKHRKQIITRKTAFELKKAKEREHILEGLVLALQSIDEVIAAIKKSKDKDDAKINLIKKFKFTERQVVAILEMRLQQLANLERIQVEKELEEKRNLIKELESILSSEKKVYNLIKTELKELKEKYGDARRTQIIKHALGDFRIEDVTPNDAVMVVITHDGYIKRMPLDTFKRQERGGKGVIGLETKEDDSVKQIFESFLHDYLLFFTSTGKVYRMKTYDVPEAGRTAKGQSIVNFLSINTDEKVHQILPLQKLQEGNRYLVMVTQNGVIKKANLKDFANIRSSGLIALKLKEDDQLKWVYPSSGDDSIILVSENGQSILFSEKDVRPMGRTAAGVRAMRLKKGDLVVGMSVIHKKDEDGYLLVIMENGYGKRTTLKYYKKQKRGGSGIKTAKITKKTGKVVYAGMVSPKDDKKDLIVIAQKGQVIRLPLESVNIIGRATQGVRLMKFKVEGDKVASTTLIQYTGESS